MSCFTCPGLHVLDYVSWVARPGPNKTCNKDLFGVDAGIIWKSTLRPGNPSPKGVYRDSYRDSYRDNLEISFEAGQAFGPLFNNK